MARGKNKAIADRRNSALAEVGSIDQLRREIHNLTQELNDRDQKAKQTITQQQQVIQRLQQEVAEVTSGKVKDLEQFITELKEHLNQATAKVADIQDTQDKFVKRLMNQYESQGMSSHEALEQAMSLLDGEPIVILDSDLYDKVKAGKLTREIARLMQTKRMSGLRKE